MSKNGSISSFFQPIAKPAKAPAPAIQRPALSQQPLVAPRCSIDGPSSSELSPPPSSSFDSSHPASLPSSVMAVPTSSGDNRVVPNSDDEDSDSDLEDIFEILKGKTSSATTQLQASIRPRAITPPQPARRVSSRRKKSVTPPDSPIASRPKYTNSLFALGSLAKKDLKYEEATKRIKLLESRSKESAAGSHGASQSTALEDVLEDQEDCDKQRVRDALRRTEATSAEMRWYFFDLDPVATPRQDFPTAAVPRFWRSELLDPKDRFDSFTTGFVSDMVKSMAHRKTKGNVDTQLPDEIVLWMLDEVPREKHPSLRHAYYNTLAGCKKQLSRVLVPAVIQSMFVGLGATASAATDLREKIVPVAILSKSYSRRDWSRLESVIKVLGQSADDMAQASRTFTLGLLLRMGTDRVVIESPEILRPFQQTLERLCKVTPDISWEACCKELCSSVFSTIESATIRLQLVTSMGSLSPRISDLRRRLATCFFFNDIALSFRQSSVTTSIPSYIARLENRTFAINRSTDYRSLASFVLLLDISIDDGRFPDIDLEDNSQATTFDGQVDMLVAKLKGIPINASGASHPSRHAAMSNIDAVCLRLECTVRSRQKPRQDILGDIAGKSLEKEAEQQQMKKSMANFVTNFALKEQSPAGEAPATEPPA